MGGRNPEAWFYRGGGGDGAPILFPSFPKLLEHLISAIRHHRSVGDMWMQPKLRGLGQCWCKGHYQNNHARHSPQSNWMLYWSNKTLPEMPLNSFVSPEHGRIAHVLMNKENRSNHMKITYSDSCKLFSHSKDILEASNWCLRVPKEHAKRSRWLGGQ